MDNFKVAVQMILLINGKHMKSIASEMDTSVAYVSMVLSQHRQMTDDFKTGIANALGVDYQDIVHLAGVLTAQDNGQFNLIHEMEHILRAIESK